MSGEASCIFCKILKGEIPGPRLYEDERFICIRDIMPKAKTHLLVVTKEHIPSLSEAFPESGAARTELMGQLLETVTRIAREQKLVSPGFRVEINTGTGAGQTIFHIHAHILSGL